MSFGQLQSTSNALAADGRTLNALKLQAGQQTTPEAIKEAAKQFESLFMRELIKSMREATMKSGLMDSSSPRCKLRYQHQRCFPLGAPGRIRPAAQ